MQNLMPRKFWWVACPGKWWRNRSVIKFNNMRCVNGSYERSE
jgi:hypothetical protein